MTCPQCGAPVTERWLIQLYNVDNPTEIIFKEVAPHTPGAAPLYEYQAQVALP